MLGKCPRCAFDIDVLLAAVREECARIAESEPEPEGQMPAKVLSLSSDPEDHVRAAVRATRASIARRIREEGERHE